MKYRICFARSIHKSWFSRRIAVKLVLVHVRPARPENFLCKERIFPLVVSVRIWSLAWEQTNQLLLRDLNKSGPSATVSSRLCVYSVGILRRLGDPNVRIVQEVEHRSFISHGCLDWSNASTGIDFLWLRVAPLLGEKFSGFGLHANQNPQMEEISAAHAKIAFAGFARLK